MSINIGAPINNKVICELSDSDHSLHPQDLKPRKSFAFISTEVSDLKFCLNCAHLSVRPKSNLSQRRNLSLKFKVGNSKRNVK